MFSMTAEYAMRAMVALASAHGTTVSSESIARRTKVPPRYMSKVMRDLTHAGLVVSQRGPRGGFALARPPAQITILDVVNAVDRFTHITSCPLGNPAHLKLCPLHQRLEDAIDAVERALSGSTLGEVVASAGPAGGATGACHGVPGAPTGP